MVLFFKQREDGIYRMVFDFVRQTEISITRQHLSSLHYYQNICKWILARSLNLILLKKFWGSHITAQMSSHAFIVHLVLLILTFRHFFRAPGSCLFYLLQMKHLLKYPYSEKLPLPWKIPGYTPAYCLIIFQKLKE